MDYKLTDDQQEFYDRALKGESIYLQGRAGTGKSFVVKKLIHSLQQRGEGVAVVAPSGIAAINIGGQTIHSLFAIPPFGVQDMNSVNSLSKNKRKVLQNITVLIIDEISMLRPDLLDGIDYSFIKNGCGKIDDRQIIFVGDEKQLPPIYNPQEKVIIEDRYQGFSFRDSHTYKRNNVAEIELKEIVRQDDIPFIQALEKVRNGIDEPYFDNFIGTKVSGVLLAPYNATVSRYNKEGLNQLETKAHTFKADIDGKAKAKDFNLEPELILKDGAKVMHLINNAEKGLVNGSLGTVRIKKGGKELVFITEEGFEKTISKHEAEKKEYIVNKKGELVMETVGIMRQYPLKLAYALTIHKS